MNRMMRAGPLLVLILIAAASGQLTVSDLPTAKTATVLPAKVPGADALAIDGPSVADVDEYVHLEVLGLPPIDSSQTLDEALKWTRSIAMRVQQPPESESVDFDVTLGFRLIPILSWKLTLDLRANVSGDYAVAFAMPGVDDTAVQLVTHGVRFGTGPVPPPPDPVIEVTPDGPFSSRGSPGGSFDPPGKGYLIANTGQGNVNWSVNVSTPWLVASPATGVLVSGQSTEVFLSFGEAAKSLPVGFHAAVATITNDTNGRGTTPRLVALTIEGSPLPPPGEKQVAFWVDPAQIDNLTAAQQAILGGLEFRVELKSKGHELLQVWSKNDGPDDADEEPWFNAAKASALSPPLILFAPRAGGKIRVQSLPATKAEIFAMLGG